MNTLIVYWSGTGNTEVLAESIRDAIKVKGGKAEIFKVGEISVDDAAKYDKILLGCPATGAEMLEKFKFEPFYQALAPKIKQKKVGFFGSYGWGGGEWMQNWLASAEKEGVKVCDYLTVRQDEFGQTKLEEFAEKFI